MLDACWDTAGEAGVAVETGVEELGTCGDVAWLTSDWVDELWSLAAATWRTAMTRALFAGRLVGRRRALRRFPLERCALACAGRGPGGPGNDPYALNGLDANGPTLSCQGEGPVPAAPCGWAICPLLGPDGPSPQGTTAMTVSPATARAIGPVRRTARLGRPPLDSQRASGRRRGYPLFFRSGLAPNLSGMRNGLT